MSCRENGPPLRRQTKEPCFRDPAQCPNTVMSVPLEFVADPLFMLCSKMSSLDWCTLSKGSRESPCVTPCHRLIGATALVQASAFFDKTQKSDKHRALQRDSVLVPARLYLAVGQRLEKQLGSLGDERSIIADGTSPMEHPTEPSNVLFWFICTRMARQDSQGNSARARETSTSSRRSLNVEAVMGSTSRYVFSGAISRHQRALEAI